MYTWPSTIIEQHNRHLLHRAIRPIRKTPFNYQNLQTYNLHTFTTRSARCVYIQCINNKFILF